MADRMLGPKHRSTGSHEISPISPCAINPLYELKVGQASAVKAGAWPSSPAGYWKARSGNPILYCLPHSPTPVRAGSKTVALVVASASDILKCAPERNSVLNGLGIKLAIAPTERATCFAITRRKIRRSQR